MSRINIEDFTKAVLKDVESIKKDGLYSFQPLNKDIYGVVRLYKYENEKAGVVIKDYISNTDISGVPYYEGFKHSEIEAKKQGFEDLEDLLSENNYDFGHLQECLGVTSITEDNGEGYLIICENGAMTEDQTIQSISDLLKKD